MSWIFHVLWMFLVVMLFFVVLRRIYYFGLAVNRPTDATSAPSSSQRFTVFTIYQSDQRTAGTAQTPSDRSQPPAYTEPPPPPKYDDVIKTADVQSNENPPPYSPNITPNQTT